MFTLLNICIKNTNIIIRQVIIFLKRNEQFYYKNYKTY